jgi:cofilin
LSHSRISDALSAASTLTTLQSTGVTVNDTVVEQFNSFKLQREPYNHRFYIYKIAESGTEIVIDTFGARSSTYDDFVAALPPNECRYGLFDLDFQTVDGRPASKLVFIAWTPDTAKVKNKMMYAGSKESLKSALVGVGVHLQATDQSELELDNIISTIQRV